MNVRTKSIFKGILENVTAVHGINHLKNSKGTSLYIWMLIMILNLLGTVQLVMIARQRYYDEQIVTELNSNCRINQVPFPAVSICNFNDVSLKEIGNIKSLLKRYNRSEEEINDFFRTLPYLKNFGWTKEEKKHFTELMAILKHHYFTMDTIMAEVHQKCDDLLLFCSFNKKPKKCSDLFRLTKTFEGFCCTFNYGALNDGNENPPNEKDDEFEYYEDDSGDKAAAVPLIATSEAGRSSGLFVVLDVEPNDYPDFSSVPYYGSKILISDPTDYIETTVKYRFLPLGESIALKVKPLIFQTDTSLRRVDPSKRNCWFHDEASLRLTDKYSFETCHTECKMATYVQYCQCLPFKYPRDQRIRICEFKDLKCLNNVKVAKSKNERQCKPICYMECNDKKYMVTSDSTTLASENIHPNITGDRNLTNLSALRVYFIKSTCTCYKLTLLIDLIYFIATYGSILSLGFGGSVITLVEISYLVIKYVIFFVTYVLSKFLRKEENFVVIS